MAYPFPTYILYHRLEISPEYLLQIVKDYVKNTIGDLIIDKKEPGGFWARVTPLTVWDDNGSIEVVGIYWDPRVPKVAFSSHYTLASINLVPVSESELRVSILANPHSRDMVIQIGIVGEEGGVPEKEVCVNYSLAEEIFPYQLALAGHIVKIISGLGAYEEWGEWITSRLAPRNDLDVLIGQQSDRSATGNHKWTEDEERAARLKYDKVNTLVKDRDLTIETACQREGISRATYYNYKKIFD